eukprot:557655-Rhodomonas_salina.2
MYSSQDEAQRKQINAFMTAFQVRRGKGATQRFEGLSAAFWGQAGCILPFETGKRWRASASLDTRGHNPGADFRRFEQIFRASPSDLPSPSLATSLPPSLYPAITPAIPPATPPFTASVYHTRSSPMLIASERLSLSLLDPSCALIVAVVVGLERRR